MWTRPVPSKRDEFPRDISSSNLLRGVLCGSVCGYCKQGSSDRLLMYCAKRNPSPILLRTCLFADQDVTKSTMQGNIILVIDPGVNYEGRVIQKFLHFIQDGRLSLVDIFNIDCLERDHSWHDRFCTCFICSKHRTKA